MPPPPFPGKKEVGGRGRAVARGGRLAVRRLRRDHLMILAPGGGAEPEGHGRGEHAEARPRVEEEETAHVAVVRGANPPGGSVAVEGHLALGPRRPLGASGLLDEQARDAEHQDEAGHRPADEAVLPWRSSRQRRTLWTRSRPLNGLVM